MADSIVVFTEVSSQDIIANRGSGDWILNPDRGGLCKYLVCCRKSHWKNMDDGLPNGAAFLVGFVRRLVPGAKNQRGQQRYFIEISQFANVSIENVWKDWRNPVRYESLENLGIEPKSLKFEPLPAASPKAKKAAISVEPTPGRLRLTIAEAKQALAATFGVQPEDVEIHIRG